MEMIVCILFFSLSAAVSAQMFAKSHTISHTAIKENHAVIEVNNLAECFYVENGDIEAIAEKYYDNKTLLASHHITVYFDSDFNVVDSLGTSSCYMLTLTVSDSEKHGMREGEIVFYENSSNKGLVEVYKLNVTVNVPNTIEMLTASSDS
jgi:hypothetical protein